MKYCLTAHILYLRITKQTHLIEPPPPPPPAKKKKLMEKKKNKKKKPFFKKNFFIKKFGKKTPPPPPRRHNKTVSGTDDIKYTTALIENMFLYDKCRNSDSLLDVRGSNPGGGARFSAPVQTVLGA